MTTIEAEVIADGPIDNSYDISHLTDREKKRRREQYNDYILKGGQLITAAGEIILFDLNTTTSKLKWKTDGNISIARNACQVCLEIDACRPPGTLPFICLVRARPACGRMDETVVCALCCLRKNTTSCRAQGGRKARVCQNMVGGSSRKSLNAAEHRSGGMDGGEEEESEQEEGDNDDDDDDTACDDDEDSEDSDYNGTYRSHGRRDAFALNGQRKSLRSKTSSYNATMPIESISQTQFATHLSQTISNQSNQDQASSSSNPIKRGHTSSPQLSLPKKRKQRMTIEDAIILSDSDGERLDARPANMNAPPTTSDSIDRGQDDASKLKQICQEQTALLSRLKGKTLQSNSVVEKLIKGQADLTRLVNTCFKSQEEKESGNEELTSMDGMKKQIEKDETKLKESTLKYQSVLLKELEKYNFDNRRG